MTTQTEALKMALEALELNNREWKATADSGDSGYWLAEEQDFYQQTEKAITAIKEALAQPEPSPEWMTEEEQTAYTFGWFKALESQRIAQPEQRSVSEHLEPVAWLWELTGEVTTDPDRADGMWLPLYTTPPQEQRSCDMRTWERPWVSLTDEEIRKLCVTTYGGYEFCRLVEAKLREKNQ